MTKRIFSTILLISIIGLIIALFGITGYVGIFIAAACISQFEFYKLIKKIGQRPFVKTGLICGLILMINEYCKIFMISSSEILFLSLAFVIFRVLFSQSLEVARSSLVSTVAGIIYIPAMCCLVLELYHTMMISGLNHKIYIFTTFWIILVSKCCDIGGMFAGKYFGKHKLSPNFSPQKTLEGLLGGMVLSNLVGIVLFFKFKNFLPNNFNFINTIILSSLLAVVGLAGDLIESAMKRLANAKDSGKIIPGIGGIFDLTDSLILTLPVGAIFVVHFIL